MSSLLTEHVRRFGTPTAGDVLPVVRRILRCYMGRMGLLSRSPAALGYPDVHSWRDEGAFDDVTHDCYLSAVVARIKGLQQALEPDRDVDPLIIRNVNRFLAERQREHNPIGYAAYQNVRAAAAVAQQAGWLALEQAPRRPVSHALLRLDDAAGPPVSAEWLTQWLAAQPDLRRVGRILSSCSRQAQAWLFDRLQALRTAAGGPIRLGCLVAAVERLARDAWPANAPPPSATATERTDDGVAVVRIVPPDAGVEDQDTYRHLLARTEQQLREMPQLPRLLARRLLVLAAVVRQAEQTGGATVRQVEIAQELGIDQVTLFRDLEVIGKIIAQVSEDT